MTIPERTRLDNAALIYPSTLTRKSAQMFRVSITLTEDVSRSYLDKALKTVIRRFPSFAYRLHYGTFWWTLRKIEGAPEIGEAGPLARFSFKKNGGYMFKLSCEDNVIYLDVFHSVTDGTGAATFLLSITAEYLRLRYGIAPQYGGMILNPCDEPTEEEFNDDFRSFIGKGSLDSFARAYHYRGTKVSREQTRITRITIPVDQIGAKAHEKGCTVTELITALMIQSIQKIRREEGRRHNRSAIQIEVPVNLRKIYSSRTLRNFSSYLILGIDVRNGESNLDETIREVSAQKNFQLLPKRLATKIYKNVALENNRLIAALPRIVKKPIMAAIKRLKSDQYTSHTFSNLGSVNLPEGMKRYVSSMDFVLGRHQEKTGASACISCGDKLVINMTRRVMENHFETYFMSELEKLGINGIHFSETGSADSSVHDICMESATLSSFSES